MTTEERFADFLVEIESLIDDDDDDGLLRTLVAGTPLVQAVCEGIPAMPQMDAHVAIQGVLGAFSAAISLGRGEHVGDALKVILGTHTAVPV